jgi:hypothetical protein
MPELIHHSYSIMRESLNHDNVLDYVSWLSSGEDGGDFWAQGTSGRYGEWSDKLKKDV